MEKTMQEDRIGVGKLLIWQSSVMSRTVTVLIMGYLMVYCTDFLKVPAAGVSLILVLSKLVDGITDAFAGFIVDKTKTRWGVARPYEIFIVGLWITTWLMFSCPAEWSTSLKYVWIFTMYVLANAVCTTFLNANGTPYLVRAFKERQIIKLTSFGSIPTMIVAIIFNLAFPIAMGRIATSPAGWSRLVAFIAVPMTAVGLLRMLFVKEKYETEVKSASGEELQVKDIFKVIKNNKYIVILSITTLVYSIIANMGVMVYYFKYIVNNTDLMGVLSLVTVLCIPLPFVFPKLIQKFSVVKLMMAGMLISALGYLINFAAGTSFPLLMVGNFFVGAGNVPVSMLMPLAIIECADYNEWKGIHRMEGTMSSFNGLATKVGNAAGVGLLGVLLQFSGFTGDIATTPESSITMIRMLYSFIPMAAFILVAVMLVFYKLDKSMPQIKEDNQHRREQAGSAER
ncbi:MAG: MFS transporter [Eubacteriales bacterium]|nr:MFS transporter [Eubacteriales bacterium]